MRVGFGYFLFGKREIHREREREWKKEIGRDEIDNKKELKIIKNNILMKW